MFGWIGADMKGLFRKRVVVSQGTSDHADLLRPSFPNVVTFVILLRFIASAEKARQRKQSER